MLERFSKDSEDGPNRLKEALRQQPALADDLSCVEPLASKGALCYFPAGETLITQNDTDDNVFFIIDGSVDVVVNGQRIQTRPSPTLVGEMVVVNPAIRRGATIKSADDVVALCVSAKDLVAVANDTPNLWRYLARLAGDRLKERARFHLPANDPPIMFIGSSLESLPVTNAISAGLKHDGGIIVRPWTTFGVFTPSEYSLLDLLREAEAADFAVLVFGSDDEIRSRDTQQVGPRDNVVFEMGLFVGRLGRERVFIVKDNDVELKIPSDLFGLNPITYKRKDGEDLANSVGTVCSELRNQVSQKGAISRRMKFV